MTDTSATENGAVVNPNHASPVVPASAVAPFPGVKIDEQSLEALAQKFAATVSTTGGQNIESEALAGLPKRVRGTIYAVGGGLSAVGSSVVAFEVANPGALPSWVTAVAAITSPILAAFTGGTAWANLGKK